jgi:hypothetical protein
MDKSLIILMLGIVFIAMGLFVGSYLKENSSAITGFATLENQTDYSSINFTKKDALLGIDESEKIIINMKDNNFSIIFMNDTLNQAKKIMEQIKYAETLKDKSASRQILREAENALKFVDLKTLNYNEVIVYTDRIKSREEQAFNIYDSILIAKNKIENYKTNNADVSEAEIIFEQAKKAFYEDRYEDAQKLVQDAVNSFESKQFETSTLNSMTIGAKNFLQRYWLYGFVFSAIFFIVGFFSYGKIRIISLKNKIKKMNANKQVLMELMKRTQEERFKENKISGLVYNIRMKKYQEKMQDIKEELPVLEKNLAILMKNKKVK